MGKKRLYLGTTNENGEILFENLYPGKYFLVETKQREEYKPNKTVFDVNIKFNEQAEITVENDIIKGYLRIIKEDLENENVRLKRCSVWIIWRKYEFAWNFRNRWKGRSNE